MFLTTHTFELIMIIVIAFRLYDIKNKQTLCYHYMYISEAAGINTFKSAYTKLNGQISVILAHLSRRVTWSAYRMEIEPACVRRVCVFNVVWY